MLYHYRSPLNTECSTSESSLIVFIMHCIVIISQQSANEFQQAFGYTHSETELYIELVLSLQISISCFRKTHKFTYFQCSFTTYLKIQGQGRAYTAL